MTREYVAAHEGGHAVALVLLGVGVKLIDIAGDATALGRVHHEGAENMCSREDAIKRMLIILSGPLMSDSWEAIPKWPLSKHRSTDEYNLAVISEALGLEKRDYDKVLHEALKLTCNREFERLHVAVTGMLDYVPRIGPELLDRLHVIALGGER